MSAQPTRQSSTRATGAQEKRTATTQFQWPTQVILREGVLENLDTGERLEVSQTTAESVVLVHKTNPARAFSVLTETSPPLYNVHQIETTNSPAESPGEGGLHRVGGSSVTQVGRLRRRLEEHRVQVEQLRQKIGDPQAALEQFMTKVFDDESIRSIYAESLEDQAPEENSEIDAQENH